MISIKFFDPKNPLNTSVVNNVGGCSTNELDRMRRQQRDLMGRPEYKFLVDEKEIDHPEFDNLPFKQEERGKKCKLQKNG